MPGIDKLLFKIDILPLPVDVFFGIIRYQPQETYGPRVQEHYQLVVVYSGHVVVHIDGQPHDLQAEEVALLKPGHHEFFEFAQDAPTHHSWCHFHWHLGDELTQALEAVPFKVAVSEHLKHFIDLGMTLQHAAHALSPSLQHVAAAAFWEFASLAALSSAEHPYGRLPKPLQRVLSFVTSSFQQELSLQRLSQVAHVTPEHLVRLFRRHLGVTPMRYVWQVRAQRGASYLRHTGLSTERIALSCGFKSAAHFSRTIKAHYGQTPLELKTRATLVGPSADRRGGGVQGLPD